MGMYWSTSFTSTWRDHPTDGYVPKTRGNVGPVSTWPNSLHGGHKSGWSIHHLRDPSWEPILQVTDVEVFASFFYIFIGFHMLSWGS